MSTGDPADTSGTDLAAHAMDARRQAVCLHLIYCHAPVMGGYRLHFDHCPHATTHYFGCIALETDRVTFRYKNYRENRQKHLALDVGEFIRRFLQHILPKGPMRIRHYGFLSNACRRKRLAQIREALDVLPQNAAEPEPAADPAIPFSGYPCPECHHGHLRIVGECCGARLSKQPFPRWHGVHGYGSNVAVSV